MVDFNFQEVIMKLFNNPYDIFTICVSAVAGAIVSSVFSLIGFIISKFVTAMFHKSKSEKKTLYYSIKTNEIERKGEMIIIKNFQINSYKNIESMQYISTICIWSGHNKTICESDIDKKYPPIILLANGLIFGAKILRPDFSQAQIISDSHLCKLYFKQFSSNDGITIQILHTNCPKGSIRLIHNMKVFKAKEVKVSPKTPVWFSALVFCLIEIFYFMGITSAILTAPINELRWISFFMYATVWLVFIILWICFNVSQSLIPSFVYDRYNH